MYAVQPLLCSFKQIILITCMIWSVLEKIRNGKTNTQHVIAFVTLNTTYFAGTIAFYNCFSILSLFAFFSKKNFQRFSWPFYLFYIYFIILFNTCIYLLFMFYSFYSIVYFHLGLKFYFYLIYYNYYYVLHPCNVYPLDVIFLFYYIPFPLICFHMISKYSIIINVLQIVPIYYLNIVHVVFFLISLTLLHVILNDVFFVFHLFIAHLKCMHAPYGYALGMKIDGNGWKKPISHFRICILSSLVSSFQGNLVILLYQTTLAQILILDCTPFNYGGRDVIVDVIIADDTKATNNKYPIG
ncbi:hypothetical protein ACJX0J_033316, partial [Zea mays]